MFTFFQQTPRLQIFLIVSCFFNVWHKNSCCSLFYVQRALVLALCRLSCHCPSATGSSLHLCLLCHRGTFVRSNSDLFQNQCFLCRFLCRQLAVPHFPPSFFAAIPILHWGTCVSSLAPNCRDCCNLVDDDVLRHRRSSESVDQQALGHQLLDCEHLYFVSDCAESVFKFVCVVDERLHVICSAFF